MDVNEALRIIRQQEKLIQSHPKPRPVAFPRQDDVNHPLDDKAMDKGFKSGMVVGALSGAGLNVSTLPWDDDFMSSIAVTVGTTPAVAIVSGLVGLALSAMYVNSSHRHQEKVAKAQTETVARRNIEYREQMDRHIEAREAAEAELAKVFKGTDFTFTLAGNRVDLIDLTERKSISGRTSAPSLFTNQ